MESRCYRGGTERTSYHELRFAWRDLLSALAVLAAVLAIRLLPPYLPR
jgi:energy-coupling factor transporter transmembrane protein EcfT